MSEKEVADLIEPIEEPMWCYCSGGRSSGKSYFAEVLSSKDDLEDTEAHIQIKCIEDWKSYIKGSNSAILSEYDEEIPFDVFFNMVEEFQKEDNPDNFANDVNVNGYRFFFEDFC